MCSTASTPEADANGAAGLRQLVPGLLAVKREPGDLAARMRCLLGARDAIGCGLLRVPMGASHGIGHQLGPLGVGHGDTSCVLLPAVMRYNKRVNEAKQQKVLDVLWGLGEDDVTAALQRRGVESGEADLTDVLEAVIAELGLPRSLKEVGVRRDQLEELARGSLGDRYCKSNPVPLREKGQVMEILEMVVGE